MRHNVTRWHSHVTQRHAMARHAILHSIANAMARRKTQLQIYKESNLLVENYICVA